MTNRQRLTDALFDLDGVATALEIWARNERSNRNPNWEEHEKTYREYANRIRHAQELIYDARRNS